MTSRLGPIDIAMGIGVAVTWGMGVVFAKAAIEHFPPILLMSLRFALTAAVLVWFVRPPLGLLRKLFAIALISAAIQYSLTFTGLKGIDAGVMALVVQLEVPFLVLLGALFLGEKASLRKWIGIVLAFVGVGLIVGEPKVGGAWVSVLLVVGGSFAWAVGQVMVRALKDIDGLTVLAWVAVFATPQLLAMSLVFESDHIAAIESAGPTVWIAVLYLGLVMTAFGYWLWYSLIRRHEVSQAAPFILLLPVVTVAGGVVFLGETLTLLVVAGGVVVIAGVGIILLERPPKITEP